MTAKDDIKQKLEITDVISEYVSLKPAGAGSMKGICPFHAERSPSFHVSRERQIFKCFGCGKGGDVFTFVMEMEGLNFVEALKALAARAGVELPEYEKPESAGRSDVFFALHELAVSFYTAVLKESSLALKHREYLKARGIDSALAEKFKLGAAPDDWDSLARFLKKKGYGDDVLAASGLCLKRKSGSGVIDRFRNRLMVPLADQNGRVVGFTARVLPGASEDAGPKYMNSPETDIYHKGSVLYGIHLAKTAARKAGEIIVVEGNLDVIASHKAGVENVVASSGTALTETQLRMLSRYVKKIVFCLDDDAAGFAAAKRVFELAMKLKETSGGLDVEIRCLVIPQGAGKDPDEVVKKDPELWRKIAAHSEEIVEFYFEKTIRQFESEQGESLSVEKRRKLIDELLPHIVRLKREDETHLYLLRLSDVTHVSLAILERMLKDKKGVSVQSKPALPVASIKPVTPQEPKAATDKRSSAAIFLLGILLKYERAAGEILKKVPNDGLSEPWGTLYREVGLLYTPSESQPNAVPRNQTLFSRLRSHLEGRGETRLVGAIDSLALRIDEMVAGMSPQMVRAEVDRHLILFKEEEQKRVRQDLEAEIRRAELSGDASKLQELMARYTSLLHPGKSPKG